MITYRDRTYCASKVKRHTCGRYLDNQNEEEAKKLGLPIAYGYFCEASLPKLSKSKRKAV